MKWTKKNVFNLFTRKHRGDSLFSAGADIRLTVFPKGTPSQMLLYGNFTESHFYRTLLFDCFWFPVTFSIYHLFYQQ